jgi:hypothetical protein
MCEHLGHCVIVESDSGDRYRMREVLQAVRHGGE